MDVSKKTFEDIRSRAEQASNDENLELEARITDKERSLDRVGFERLLRYLTKTKETYEPVVESLDVTVGPHRATIMDIDRISELCSSWSKTSLMQLYETAPDSIIVLRKEQTQKRVEIYEYNAAVSLKRESSISDPTDPLKAMSAAGRLYSFRLKKRFSFLSANNAFRIDCTVVKAASGAASIDALVNVPETFEVEVEFIDKDSVARGRGSLSEAIAKKLLSNIAEMLVVLRDHRSGPILTTSVRTKVLSEYAKLSKMKTIGPKPVTLERGNLMEESTDTPSIRDSAAGPYTVTDKADGTRFMLFINSNGDGYLLNEKRDVMSTGISAPGAANSILDGELVKRSKINMPINLFVVFDVYFVRGKDVRNLPLVDLSNPNTDTRIGYMKGDGSIGASLSTSSDPIIRAKEFVSTRDAKRLYDKYIGPSGPEYDIDGLILTPEKLGVYQDRLDKPLAGKEPTGTTWNRVFKWKPASENSIDFRVQYDKTSKGDIAMYNGKLRAKLTVGIQDVVRGLDPYDIIAGSSIDKKTMYRPFDVDDYGLLKPGNENSVSPGLFIHPGRDLPRCTYPPHDVIHDETVVEFSWSTDSGEWVPLRVRHDKKGRPNHFDTAISVWRSIAFPVELENIVDPTSIVSTGASAKDDVYFEETSAGSASDVMRKFHRRWVIKNLLYKKASEYLSKDKEKPDDLRLLDLACGRGADIRSWMQHGFTTVLGLDLFEDNLIGQSEAGAYARFAKIKDMKQFSSKTYNYAFVTADVGKRLTPKYADTIVNPSIRKIAQAVWRSPKAKPDPKLSKIDGIGRRLFDVVSCQNAAHYFFESEEILDAFLDNVSENLRPGGLFIGTCMDGDAMIEEFSKAKERTGQDKVIDAIDESGDVVWRIEKRFDNDSDVYGRAAAVFVETINKVNIEYLVDFYVMTEKLHDRGLRLLSDSETKDYGIDSSSALFGYVHKTTDWDQLTEQFPGDTSLPKIKTMEDNLKRFSFMNRYFVFVKMFSPE